MRSTYFNRCELATVLLALSFASNHCGTSVAGNDGGAWPTDAVTDVVGPPISDTPQTVDSPAVDARTLQQPELRFFVESLLVDAQNVVLLTSRPRLAFDPNGGVGFEQTIDGCVVRRRVNWPPWDLGPIEFGVQGRLQSSLLDANTGYAAIIRDVSVQSGDPIRVLGTIPQYGPFDLTARKPPRVRPIFPRPTDDALMGHLPLSNAFVIQWEPIASDYEMFIRVGGTEPSGATISLWCRAPSSAGRYAFSSRVLDVMRDVRRNVDLLIGLSDERRAMVGTVPVVLSTINTVAFVTVN